MFDQNATIKEEEEVEGQDDDHSDVVNIQPGNSTSVTFNESTNFYILATPTEESQTDSSFNANSSQQVCYFEK